MKALQKLKSIAEGWLNSQILHPEKIHNAVVRRLAICEECPSLQRMKLVDQTTCGECGCFINAHAWSPSEQCPLGKWKPLDDRGNEIE
jgi:hypothetical protein